MGKGAATGGKDWCKAGRAMPIASL